MNTLTTKFLISIYTYFFSEFTIMFAETLNEDMIGPVALDVGLAGAVDELHLPGLGVPAHHGRVLRRVVDLQGGGLGHAAAGCGRHQAAVRHVTIVLKVNTEVIEI